MLITLSVKQPFLISMIQEKMTSVILYFTEYFDRSWTFHRFWNLDQRAYVYALDLFFLLLNTFMDCTTLLYFSFNH